MGKRKHVRETINNVKSLKDRHEYLEKELVRLEGQASFDAMGKFYDDALDKLSQELYSLPIGNRYTGIFYIKKPYTVPTEYIKIEGSAFLREDLVRWQIENLEKYRGSYFRAIYKNPNDKKESEITREDGGLVYDVRQEEVV